MNHHPEAEEHQLQGTKEEDGHKLQHLLIWMNNALDSYLDKICNYP